MQETNVILKTKGQKALAILMGALLMGFLWKVRGTGGWGSSWGLLNAGFVFSLFVVAIKGARKKMSLAWLSISSIMFMLTVPAWGTILDQICGYLYTGEFVDGNGSNVYEISVFSAVFLMLCLGFGVATLYGIMLGRGYSDKPWKWWHFAALLGVFFAVRYITMATASHWIVNLIQPQAAECFADNLKIAGKDGSVYENYMQHFNNISWAKKIEGGRNYFSEIQVVSSVFSSIAAILATRFIVKDKRAARTGLVVSAAFAVSITVADLFFFFGCGGYHRLNPSIFSESFATWGMWEYFTGFIAGGVITAFIVGLKNTEDVPEKLSIALPDKIRNAFNLVLGFVFLIGVAVVRPVLERMKDSNVLIVSVIVAVVTVILIVVYSVKRFGYNPDKMDMYGFSKFLIPFVLTIITVIYMFIGIKEKQEYTAVFDGSVVNILLLVSFVCLTAWSIALNVKKHNV